MAVEFLEAFADLVHNVQPVGDGKRGEVYKVRGRIQPVVYQIEKRQAVRLQDHDLAAVQGFVDPAVPAQLAGNGVSVLVQCDMMHEMVSPEIGGVPVVPVGRSSGPPGIDGHDLQTVIPAAVKGTALRGFSREADPQDLLGLGILRPRHGAALKGVVSVFSSVFAVAKNTFSHGYLCQLTRIRVASIVKLSSDSESCTSS